MTDADDLRFFLCLTHAGSLTEAARRLDSSPPAMSRRLASLEARLGVGLVERTSRRFRLTEEGLLLHDYAQSIVARLNEMEAEITALRGVPTGSLRIAAPMEIGRQKIAPLIGAFAHRYPKVTCELVLSDAGLDVVRNGFDFVFRTTPSEEPEVVCQALLNSRRVVCAAPDYLAIHGVPSVPAELRTHACLCLVRDRRRFDRWRFIIAGEPVIIDIAGALSSTSGEVIHQWALEGRGIAFKAKWDIEDDLRAERLVECLSEFASDDMHLYGVFLARRQQAPRMRAFIDFVKQSFG